MGDTWWAIIICPCVNVFSRTLWEGILSLSVIFLLDFGTVPTVWYFLFFSLYYDLHHCSDILKMKNKKYKGFPRVRIISNLTYNRANDVLYINKYIPKKT
jgi:hypothetical protein